MANGVTVSTGNDTGLPTGTKFDTVDGGGIGHTPAVVIGYSDGSGTKVTSDVDGLLVQGETTLNGTTNDTASRSTVNDTATSTTLIAANAGRIGWRIKNTSSAILHISYGGTASSTNCIASLAQNEYAGDAGIGQYTGAINGVWASDPNAGVAVCTEW